MSKSDTWMPFYVADYLADTMHFKTAQHGAYVLLIMATWKAGGEIPDDDEQLAAITRQGTADFRRMRPILAPKFETGGGVWRHKRVTLELGKATAKYATKVANGKLGGRGHKANGKANAKLNGSETKDNHNHNNKGLSLPTETPVPINQAANAALSGSKPDDAIDRKAERTKKYRADAVAALAFLNEKTGSAYEPVASNIDPIVARFKEGFSLSQCRQVIAKKTREWKDDAAMGQYLRPKTLFNATNFANYAGTLVVVPDDETTGSTP